MADADLALLLRAWPDGPPEAETAFLKSLPVDRANLVRRRLAAVLDAEADERVADLSSVAAAAGLGRVAFYKLRRRWAERRSLPTLAPYSAGRPRSDGSGPRFELATREVRRLLRDLQGERNGTIARLVSDRLGGDPSLSAVVKIVKRERRAETVVPSALRRNYGTSVLIDVCGLSLMLAGTDDAVVGCFVLEEGSLLILGASVGTTSRHPTVRDAVLDAIENLARLEADTPEVRKVVQLTVVEPDTGAVSNPRPEVAAGSAASVKIISSGPRRYGIRLSSRMGPRIGRLRLQPGTTAAPAPRLRARQTMLEPDGLPDAVPLVMREIAAHNEPVLERLRSTRLIGPGVGRPAGAMSTALSALVI